MHRSQLNDNLLIYRKVSFGPICAKTRLSRYLAETSYLAFLHQLTDNPMNKLTQTIVSAGLLGCALAAPAQANTLSFSGTLFKNASGTSFDTWKFNIQTAGSFTVDVAAYEASQSNIATAGYYTSDINGDGELTWLDPDTYFYKDTGAALQATDAIVRCDDTANNCAVYQNGLNAATSPLVVTTHQQNETFLDGSVHYRRDPWFEVNTVTPGNYLYLIADYLLSSTEAQGGINSNDSFSSPSGFVSPITDHADYRITLSSDTLNFSLNGSVITVTAVPLPGALGLFASAFAGLGLLGRRQIKAA